MTTTRPAPRHGKLPNPGERESVLDLLARANAQGRKAPPMGSKPYEPACRSCATSRVKRDANGVRVAYPCAACGAVRG